MKCLILAAGYATRLYPITENFPKPLLKVGKKTILDWLIDDLDGSGLVEEYIVISNHKFVCDFQQWAALKNPKITVIDDGTSTDDTRLGAVCDIKFAIDSLSLSGDLLVIAGDNVLDFSLQNFVRYALEKKTSCVMRYYEPLQERLHRCGVLELDGDLIIGMEEKPAEPRSHWCCPPFYFYKEEDAARLSLAVAEGCGTDAPGSFISWLCRQTAIHAMEMPGRRYDIGNLESYERVQNEYKGILK